jgi:hypothetical protein
MTEHLETDYVRVTGEGGVLWLERKPAPYPDVETFQSEMLRTMEAVVRSDIAYTGMVLDARAVVGRNDTPFEQAADTMVKLALERVPRIAMLMKTAVGVLQGNRMSGDNERVLITNDEDAARRFAATGER